MQVSCVKGRNADQLHLHWMLLKDVSLFEVIKNNSAEEFKLSNLFPLQKHSYNTYNSNKVTYAHTKDKKRNLPMPGFEPGFPA